MSHPPDFAVLVNAIRERPDDGQRWLALASWLADQGRYDEAAAVEAFWPTLRDTVIVSGVSVHATLRQMAREAKALGDITREFLRGLEESPDAR
jgi:uncharacterized protein (TIGR02996 family)